MSPEAKGEHPLGEAIDAIFKDGYGETTKGRIALAAHLLSPYVSQLDYLQDQREATHENVGSASQLDVSLRELGFSAIFAPVIFNGSDISEKPNTERTQEASDGDEDETIIYFNPIEKAKLALTAKTDGVRAVHHLSWFQSRRAIALSRRSLR